MYQLSYKHIPKEWINGLPLGNGRLAAMYWGDETRDILSLNHEHLWRGKYRDREADCVADKLPCEISARDVFMMDSSNMQPEEWSALARAIDEALKDCSINVAE